MNTYFVSILGKDGRQSLSVRTEKGLETFFLLEDVQDRNTVRGRIIGFAKNNENRMTPIVACYNGQLRFFTELCAYPRGIEYKPYVPLNSEKAPIVFLFRLHEIQGHKNITRTSVKDADKTLRFKFNILLAALSGKPCEIKMLPSDKINDCNFMITINPCRIDYTKFCSLKKKRLQQKAFGNIDISEFLSFLNDHLKSNATITNGEKKHFLVDIKSLLKKQVIWLPTSTKDALLRVASQNNISVSLMFEQWLSVAKIDTRSSDSYSVIEKLTKAVRYMEREEQGDE